MVRSGWLQKGNANQTGASIDGRAFYTAHQSVEVGTCDGVDRSDDLILVPVLLPRAVWYGVAKIGRKAEWPSWTPTEEIKRRRGNIPDFVEGGPHNPMSARALYLYQGDKDTLFRIHGTNQPENIGRAISSGCIRMTNEDVIDLYNRVKMGTIVVVLAPNQIDSSPPVRPWG